MSDPKGMVQGTGKTGYQRLAERINPGLAGQTGVEYASSLLNVSIILFSSLPFIAGLVWLALRTDLGVLQENGFFLLLLLLLGAVFNRYTFSLQFELRPGVLVTSSGTLYYLVGISALFIFGPAAYWLSVLVVIVRTLVQIGREPQPNQRWGYAGTMVLSLAASTLALLAAFSAYESLGGTVPLQALDRGALLPMVVFVVLYWLLPLIALLPLGFAMSRMPGLMSDRRQSLGEMLLFLFVSSSLQDVAIPFAFLGAAIYTLNGAGYYLFFIAGLLMVSVLASSLTDNAAQRAQRARELSVLEELGRQIIAAPPDLSTLPAILERQLPKMFVAGRLAVWIDPDRMLFQTAVDRFLRLDAVKNTLRSSTHPFEVLEPQAVVDDPLRQGVGVPIRNDAGGLLGGVYFDVRRDLGHLRDFIPALQALAAQIASALYRAEAHQEAILKERMSNELELAGKIQANFLPEFVPEYPGYDIAASLTPARQTSGDFYDFIPLPGGRLGFLIADVADKGTGAALFMALSRTLLRTYALEHPDDPELVLALANARIHEDTQSQLFVTIFYAVLDPEAHTLTYVNGGHNPPYLFQEMAGGKNGPPAALVRTGVPLGIFEDARWERASVALEPGATLVLYTDGVTEAQNQAEAFFEDERLVEVIQSCLASGSQGLMGEILGAVQVFVGEAPQFDDLTLMVLKRKL
jgi:serine phosphatase RsbU (regulator of sigma subunit)